MKLKLDIFKTKKGKIIVFIPIINIVILKYTNDNNNIIWTKMSPIKIKMLLKHFIGLKC